MLNWMDGEIDLERSGKELSRVGKGRDREGINSASLEDVGAGNSDSSSSILMATWAIVEGSSPSFLRILLCWVYYGGVHRTRVQKRKLNLKRRESQLGRGRFDFFIIIF